MLLVVRPRIIGCLWRKIDVHTISSNINKWRTNTTGFLQVGRFLPDSGCVEAIHRKVVGASEITGVGRRLRDSHLKQTLDSLVAAAATVPTSAPRR